MKIRRVVTGALGCLLLGAVYPGLAQESASYRISENALNAGGHPAQGVVMSSASFRITLDATGDPLAAPGLASASFTMQSGTIASGRPPGEVTGQVFLGDGTTLQWNPEPSAGTYRVYRGLLSARSATNYGSCHQQGIAGISTTDNETPPAADGYMYILTVENFLGEEGTMGYTSALTERPNTAPCP